MLAVGLKIWITAYLVVHSDSPRDCEIKSVQRIVEVEFVYSQSQRVLRGASLQDFCKLQGDGFSASISSALSAQSNFSAFLPAVLEI